MAVTSGFFDAKEEQGEPDRLYNAETMSSLFDGIITEGVFSNIGSAFTPSVMSNTRIVRIGIGKAWLKSRWIYNTTTFSVVIPSAPVSPNNSRIDSIVLDMDLSESVRRGTITLVQGVEAQTPIKPTLINTTTKKQMAICHVTSRGGSTYVRQDDVEYVVGTTECPYIEFVTSDQGDSVLPIEKGGTGATTKSAAKGNLGIVIGTTAPEEMASQLDTNDIYIYITN